MPENTAAPVIAPPQIAPKFVLVATAGVLNN
jgi:hypothetical protein